MGQEDVAEVLRKSYPNFIGWEEVVEITGLSKSSVCRSLKKLERHEDVQVKIVWGTRSTSRWVSLYRINTEEKNGASKFREKKQK